MEEALRSAAVQQEAALRDQAEGRGGRRTTRLQGAVEDALFIRLVKRRMCNCVRAHMCWDEDWQSLGSLLAVSWQSLVMHVKKGCGTCMLVCVRHNLPQEL